MIFAPKGLIVGGVVDPNDLAQEFIEASRIAESQTQYQWENKALFNGAAPVTSQLVEGAPVRIVSVKQSAFLRADTSSVPKVHRTDTTTGFDPDLTVASGDPELFQIPYNRGYNLITGTNDMRLKWVSEYPEMIYIIFSYQYTRLKRNGFGLNTDDDEAFIRFKLQLQLDGSGVYGSGLSGVGTTDGFRGTGYGVRNLRTTHRTISFTGAGPHTVEALAGQAPCTSVAQDTDTEEAMAFFGRPPNEGVCIGHRTLTVIRFPKGKELGG